MSFPALTIAQIEAGLEAALQMVSELAPLAAMGGPAAGAIGVLVGQAAAVADALVAQVSGDAAIIAGGDLGKITALQTQLQAANVALATQVAAS